MKKNQSIIDESEKNKVVESGLIFHSINLEIQKDDQGQPVMNLDYPDRFKKIPKNLPKFKSIQVVTKFDPNKNSSIIPTGEIYDNIGIDVDNKGDTINQFEKICMKNNYYSNTFTIKTMHDGFHYHYRLTDNQKEQLKDFQSLDGKLFGLSIDIKYNRQILFGPTRLKINDKIYQYNVLKTNKRDLLPDFIFNEIIRCRNEPEIKKSKKDTKTKTKKNEIKEINNDNIYNMNNVRLENYLNCLNQFRFDDYKEWIKIIYIIKNENGSNELIHKISKKSYKYNENECNEKIKYIDANRNNEQQANMTTLINMAKYDNYPEYKKVLLKDSEYILNEIIKKGISDVMAAYLFYSYRSEDYLYDVDNKDLYKINKYGIYQRDPSYGMIMNDINDTLLKELDEQTMKRVNDIKDDEKKGIMLKIYIKNRSYLLKTKNKNEIVNELRLLYGQSKLFEQFDNVNNNIIAFNNGVYDLIENKFRMGKPEELITCTTGYDYEEPDKNILNELNKIISDIMPTEENKTYLLKTLSLGLLGANPLEEFYIWIGTGRNGKGLLRDLMSQTLGNYFDNMEIEYLCKSNHQSHANSADPVMARKKNSRIVVTTEIEGDVHLRCAKLKQISGNDPVQVRNLFKDSFNFVPKFKLIIQTNKEPHIDGHDGGIVLRLRFIKFNTKFVDNPVMPHEKKIDRSLKEKLKNNKNKYANAFFKILLDSYNDFIKNNNNRLDMPPQIKQDTQDFLEQNDPVALFIDSNIIKTNDKKDVISSSEIYNEFQKFCEENKFKTMKTNEFKNTMINKGIPSIRANTGIKFTNIKLKQEEPKEKPFDKSKFIEGCEEIKL